MQIKQTQMDNMIDLTHNKYRNMCVTLNKKCKLNGMYGTKN